MELVIASANPGKILQIKNIFEGLPLILRSLSDEGLESAGPEDGISLEENSLSKAQYVLQKTRKWVMSDDTGLFIDALHGAPGIFAARWAGEGKSTYEITEHTLDKLRDVPFSARTATFRTVATLIASDGTYYQFAGETKGRLLQTRQCEAKQGMPYSPLFMPEGESRVLGQLTTEEENALSHRGKAFRQVRTYLEKMVGK